MKDLIVTGYIAEGTELPGIYEQLWDLGCGFRVDMKKIPIHQATVERCELDGTDPYEARCGADCRLMAVDHAGPVLEELEAQGVHAVLIGYTTKDKDRILRIEDRVRYLNKPRRQNGEV